MGVMGERISIAYTCKPVIQRETARPSEESRALAESGACPAGLGDLLNQEDVKRFLAYARDDSDGLDERANE